MISETTINNMYEKIVKDKDGDVDWFLTNQANGLYTNTVRKEDGTYDYFPKWVHLPVEVMVGTPQYEKGTKGFVTSECTGFIGINQADGKGKVILKSNCRILGSMEGVPRLENVNSRNGTWDDIIKEFQKENPRDRDFMSLVEWCEKKNYNMSKPKLVEHE